MELKRWDIAIKNHDTPILDVGIHGVDEEKPLNAWAEVIKRVEDGAEIVEDREEDAIEILDVAEEDKVVLGEGVETAEQMNRLPVCAAAERKVSSSRCVGTRRRYLAKSSRKSRIRSSNTSEAASKSPALA